MVNVSIEGDAHVRVNESGGYVEVCVMADHDSQASYEVTISTMSGSATGITRHKRFCHCYDYFSW